MGFAQGMGRDCAGRVMWRVMWRIFGDVVGGFLIAGMAVCVVGFLVVRSLFAEPEHKKFLRMRT